MTDSGFVPLVPRRLVPQAALAQPDAGGQASLIPPDAGGQAPLAPPDVGGQASLAPFVSESLDEVRVRAAAIELAAAACARALRYAVDRNPRLLARFVDDALRAAGSPKTATVRVAPLSTIASATSTAHDIVADDTLSPGDVFVDCDAGTLGATIDERAAHLVRAAAS